jgi:sialic acid synthase SpsE
LTDDDLLQAAIDTGIPLIVSTGMSTEEEVVHAIGLLETAKQETWILHCNSSYPTKDEKVNLSTMHTLKKLAPFAHIGFSSHSVSPLVPVASIYMGAEMIETHFTTDRSLPGGDMAASLEPAGLSLIAREIKRSKKIIGNGQIKLHDSELEPRKKLRIR